MAEKGIMVWDEVEGSLFLVKAKSGPAAYKCSHIDLVIFTNPDLQLPHSGEKSWFKLLPGVHMISARTPMLLLETALNHACDAD